MHHHLRSAPSPPASPGTSIRRFYASGLIEAAEAGQLEEVEQALSRGIPVNSQTKHGTTALMKACEKGHLDIIRKLLAAGADAAVTNHFGETAATLAAASNQPEAARLLPGGTHDYSEPNAEGKPCRQCFKVVGVGREGLFCRCCSLCKDCGKKTACGADVLHDPGSPAKVRRNGAVPHQWPARSAARPSPLAAPPRTSPLAAAPPPAGGAPAWQPSERAAAATDGRLRERRIDDATIALQIDDEESFRGKKPGRPAGRSALLLRILAALLTVALLGAIVLYSQRPGLAPAAPPLDFEPL